MVMARPSTNGMLSATARGAAIGWLAALPFLALGMTGFWLQRDSSGVASVALEIGAIACVALALIAPGVLCAYTSERRGVSAFAVATLKGLLVGIASLVVASLLSAVEAFRPESISFFAQEFASAHGMAATVPTVLAVGWTAYLAWAGGSQRRLMGIAVAALAGAAGVVLWWWSAGVAYDALRFSNADSILLMAQTVALAALVIACIADAALCKRAPGV